jgi:membrane dipeptidase
MTGPATTEVVCDLHSDMLAECYLAAPGTHPRDAIRAQLDQMREARIHARWATIGGDWLALLPRWAPSLLVATLELLDALAEIEAEEEVAVVGTGTELEQALAAGKLAILPVLEGGAPLEGSVRVLRRLHELGLRCLGLTHRVRNELADGNAEADTNAGLTAFGREVVREAGRLGLVLDISHLSGRAIDDVLTLASGPVVASHSNARALCDHPRNLSDDHLRAIADSGGIVGIAFCSDYLTPDPGAATVDSIVTHLEYVAELIGPEHTGLGPDVVDYLPVPAVTATFPPGAATAGGVRTVLARLEDRGWGRDDIALVASRSAVRACKAALG